MKKLKKYFKFETNLIFHIAKNILDEAEKLLYKKSKKVKQMYKKHFFIILVILFLSSITSYSNEDLNSIFTNQLEGYKLLHFKKDNFTNSGHDEYIAFYKEDKGTDNKNNDIDKVCVFMIKDNKITTSYDLNAWSLSYKKSDLQVINGNSDEFGKWDGFCYINDINNNGINEIIFFSSPGIGLNLNIYEFYKNNFRIVLNGPEDGVLTKIETEVISNTKTIKLYGGNFKENKKSYRYWYRYVWNKKTGIYAFIEKVKEEVKR